MGKVVNRRSGLDMGDPGFDRSFKKMTRFVWIWVAIWMALFLAAFGVALHFILKYW